MHERYEILFVFKPTDAVAHEQRAMRNDAMMLTYCVVTHELTTEYRVKSECMYRSLSSATRKKEKEKRENRN